jgi:hypothetical protein
MPTAVVARVEINLLTIRRRKLIRIAIASHSTAAAAMRPKGQKLAAASVFPYNPLSRA